MIELETQFQVVIATIVFSMVVSNLYSFFDIMLRKSKVLRFVIELCFFITCSCLYYALLFYLNGGVLNIYIPVCFILGYYLHNKFYDKYFSCLYYSLFSKIHSIIDDKKERCKKLWRGLMSKIIKKAK